MSDFSPEALVHHLCRLIVMALLAMAPASAPSFADDSWFDKQWTKVAAAPAQLLSRWRTVVVPAAPDVARKATTVAYAPPTPAVVRPLSGYAHELSGLASYYDEVQMTSSGEQFDKRALTAAHKTLPLGTRVRVTNLSNGKSTIVRINDRGPFKAGRVIDLSEAAAEQIAMTATGLARVAIEVVR